MDAEAPDPVGTRARLGNQNAIDFCWLLKDGGCGSARRNPFAESVDEKSFFRWT